MAKSRKRARRPVPDEPKQSIREARLQFWELVFLLMVVIGGALLAFGHVGQDLGTYYRGGIAAIGVLGYLIIWVLKKRDNRGKSGPKELGRD